MSQDLKINQEPEELGRKPSLNGDIVEHKVIQEDAVFGTITEDGPNYRNVGWLGTTALMLKTQIGLGVLSMPVVFNTLGIVPGILTLIIIAGVTTWADYEVYVFKINHPEVYGIDDVGRMFFGRWGYEIFGAMYCLYFTCVSGSAMLSISIALNAISTHATCTAVFVAVAAIIVFIFASIRTLGRISWLAWVGAICIITAVFVVTIAVGLQDRPAAAPKEGIFEAHYKLFNKPTFTDAMSMVSTLVFTYAGTPAFFNVIAEMRDPHHYPRALAICQITVTSIYIIVATIVCYFCGSYVASPALGSAGVLIKKVAYGIALPGLSVSGILLLHLPAKHIFVRLLRGTEHLTSNTVTHWVTWIGCTLGLTIVAYVVASGVPIFGGLVSLIGASLATFLTLQPYGGMWIYDNWKDRKNPTMKWRLMFAWCILVIIGGTFIMIAGTYGAIAGIIRDYHASGGSPAWGCADNSNSV